MSLIHESTDDEYHEPYEYSHDAARIHLPCGSGNRRYDSGDCYQCTNCFEFLTFGHDPPPSFEQREHIRDTQSRVPVLPPTLAAGEIWRKFRIPYDYMILNQLCTAL